MLIWHQKHLGGSAFLSALLGFQSAGLPKSKRAADIESKEAALTNEIQRNMEALERLQAEKESAVFRVRRGEGLLSYCYLYRWVTSTFERLLQKQVEDSVFSSIDIATVGASASSYIYKVNCRELS